MTVTVTMLSGLLLGYLLGRWLEARRWRRVANSGQHSHRSGGAWYVIQVDSFRNVGWKPGDDITSGVKGTRLSHFD